MLFSFLNDRFSQCLCEHHYHIALNTSDPTRAWAQWNTMEDKGALQLIGAAFIWKSQSHIHHRGWASTFLFCFVLSSRRSCPFHFHLSVLCGERLEGIGSTCLLSIPIYIFILMKLKLAAIAFIFWNTIFLSVVKTNISKIHWCKCWLWSSSYDSWKVSS